MEDNLLGIIMIILGVISFVFLKRQGISLEFKQKGNRIHVTKYEAKTILNPNHRSVKAKSLQHLMGFMDENIWLNMFRLEERKKVSELLSRPPVYVKRFSFDQFPTHKTVSLEIAEQLLNYVTNVTERQILSHGEKWGEIIM